MKPQLLAPALACLLGACAAQPPAGLAGHDTVTAKLGLRLVGGDRHLLGAADPWVVANLTSVEVHLYHNTGSAWEEAGNGTGLVFNAGSYNLAQPLKMSFSNLAHNASYRLVAIAKGDDGLSSTGATGAAAPDVDSHSSGTRRADENFALTPAAIAAAATAGSRFDFSTTSDESLDLTVGASPANLSLKLRDKYFIGHAQGVAVSVTPGLVTDPAATAPTLTSGLQSTSFDIGGVITPQTWYDTGVDLAVGEEFAVSAQAYNGGTTDFYYDHFTNAVIAAGGLASEPLTSCWVPNTGSLGDYGAVIGKIGAAGPAFAVGSHLPFTAATAAGHLFLTINNHGDDGSSGGTVIGSVSTR